MYQVRLLIALILGLHASFSSLSEFITVVLTTNEGLLFLVIGNLEGAALSLILFSLTVVSFPLLLDREVDFVTAMVTSVRAVVASPLPMIGWAAAITRASGRLHDPLVPRASRDAAGARPCDLASLPADRGAGGCVIIARHCRRKTTSDVVPAKAGTHNPRRLLIRAGGLPLCPTLGPVVMGPGSRSLALACPGRQ